MGYSNIEMEQMAQALARHLDRRDIVGYAAARNTRILQAELQEYSERKEQLIREHGTDELDSAGNPTGNIRIDAGTPAFEAFAAGIEQYAHIVHEPQLMRIPYKEAIGRLSGSEILELDWMFEEGADD